MAQRLPQLGQKELPFVDVHSRDVMAPPEECWDAIVAVMPGSGLPRAVATALGCTYRQRNGPGDRVGSSMPGFRVAVSERPRVWVLEGAHRFSTYRLRFEVEHFESGRSRVTASTFADFPGLFGSAYRLAVIGSRGHLVAVGQMLRRIAHRAERRV